ncbi:MAG: hypothetical protein IPM14_18025 [bacterium]|nr:hypothetical protein [bacterium]
MSFIRIYLFLSVFIVFFVQVNYAQKAASVVKPDYTADIDSTKKIYSAKEDSLIINLRTLPDGFLDKYKNDSAFNYDGGPKEADDWITKIKNWINQQLIILSSSKAYSTLLDILYYGLMAIALILIIRGLLKADRRGFLFGKINSSELKLSEEDEDINQMNFDDHISAAIESKQYKIAIRYMYLKSLQLLSGKGLIELRNNKTNYQYLNEIRDIQIASVFRNTTLGFERIWYGDFLVDESIINSFKVDFNKLYALIKA